MYTVIGVRIEHYFGSVTVGHNCDFSEETQQLEKVIVFAIKEGKKFKCELTTSYGTCGSGWTTASWGHDEMTEVSSFECGFTHVPKEYMEVQCLIDNPYFGHSDDGGDSYYPGGCHYINLEFFVPTGRGVDKPVIFIFTGKSGIGKSFIASKLQGMEVYETDSNQTLNIPLTTNVVVLGNKYDYTVEDVVKCFHGCECRIVRFE
jgi:hypothetical protein